jgi:predicted acyl esterase
MSRHERQERLMKNPDYTIAYPNPTPPGVTLQKNVYCTMRDGVKIALDIYQPAQGNGTWPVILAYSPFPKERIFESAKPAFYCAHGYICIQASERGSGFNQGKFSFHGDIAAQDGYDLVEWIAQQPWCNGNVGMMGASGYGVMQWLTAPLNPPHLKALVVLATTDNYRGLCYPGGVLRKPFVLTLVAGLTQGAIWPGPISGKKPPMNVITEILAHTEDGPFWHEHGGGWVRTSEIKAPVMNVVNVPNRLHAIYHLRSYSDIKSPKKLVITPWTNENYQPWIFETTAFNMYLLRWLDYWLKEVDTGIMDEPEVAIYDSGTGKWQYEVEYPLKRTRWEKYYLHTGAINQTLPTVDEKPDSYENVSLNTALTASYGIVAPQSQQPNYIEYLSPPLEKDIRIWGPVALTLYASTTEDITSDWSFFVKMGEMVTEGVPLNPVTGLPEVKPEANDIQTPENVQIWSWGSLKAKYREVDKDLSRPGLPWHPFRNPEELKPNDIYEFQVELQPVFKTFRKGCRIWLKIACDDVLFSTLDSSSRYVETPVSPENCRISIYHNADHPSHLLLPVIPDAPDIAPVESPLCDAVPGAPRFTEESA